MHSFWTLIISTLRFSCTANVTAAHPTQHPTLRPSYEPTFQIPHNIICDGTNGCAGNTLICDENKDCNIFCSAANSCEKSTIICPSFGDCNIRCTESESCQTAIINATNQDGSFHLYCETNTTDSALNKNMCRNIQVYGSRLTNNSGTIFDVVCGHRQVACRQSKIECALDMDCHIDCVGHIAKDNTKTTCRQADITGPIGHRLDIKCEDQQACMDAVFRAADSSTLNIKCTEPNACSDVEFHCPSHSDYGPNCIVSGTVYHMYKTIQFEIHVLIHIT